MKIEEIIYGSFEIKEPILVNLINSKPLQRLKRIEQYGAERYISENMYIGVVLSTNWIS